MTATAALTAAIVFRFVIIDLMLLGGILGVLYSKIFYCSSA